jgi:cytochrome c oxidase subunit 2
MPEPATEEAPLILQLWQGSWIVAGFVTLLVYGLIALAIILYRRRRGDEIPPQTRYNIPIEVLYTVVPLIIVFGLFYFTARDQTEIMELTDDFDHSVNVVAYRWSWGFNYMEEDTYDVGTPAVAPVLYLPVNEKVRFELTSPDVIHSFWVPDFLFKMDVVPGRINKFELTPNKLGEFPGRCAELCGVDHSRMLFSVKVVSRPEFDQHMQNLRDRGYSGLLDTGRVLAELAGTPNCEGPEASVLACRERDA